MDGTAQQGGFLLGAGAQKAGTTWLHAYLTHFDDVDFGPIKEYHIWDGLSVPEFAEFDTRGRSVPLRRRLRAAWRGIGGGAPDELLLRRRLQSDPARYFDFFAALLARPGVRMTGDITPSYSALPLPVLSRIRAGFAERGIPTRAVFLMRDPVERCLSAIRMYRRAGKSMQGVDITLPDDEMLMRYVTGPQALLRTDYPAALDRLGAAFEPQALHVGFYETMFEAEEFARLNAFLGCTPDPAFIARRFNTTEREAALAPELRARAARALRGIYDETARRFPQAETLWAASYSAL